MKEKFKKRMNEIYCEKCFNSKTSTDTPEVKNEKNSPVKFIKIPVKVEEINCSLEIKIIVKKRNNKKKHNNSFFKDLEPWEKKVVTSKEKYQGYLPFQKFEGKEIIKRLVIIKNTEKIMTYKQFLELPCNEKKIAKIKKRIKQL